MAFVKDANYYLKRLADLPYDFSKSISELKAEAISKRLTTSSISELVQRLKLEVTPDNYASDVKNTLSSIINLLAHFKLRLVPLSLPVNLGFEESIFITPSPDVTNDEDIALVTNIVKSGRAPQNSDLVHISRMNEKMANYNIMLRVFEALFVVCQGPLEPHQRIFINELLSELPMPQEGRVYLKTCYTYATTHSPHRCDYKDPSHCFKALSSDKNERICSILSEIYAKGGGNSRLDESFPNIELLRKLCSKIHMMRLTPSFITAPLEDHPKSSRIKPLREPQHHQKINNDAEPTGVTDNPNETALKAIALLKEHCVLESPIIELIADRLKLNQGMFPKKLPDFSKIEFVRLKGLNYRPSAFFYYTKDLNESLSFPMMLCSNQNKEDALLEQQALPLYKALLKKSVKKDEADIQKILGWNYYFALIIRPLFDQDAKQGLLLALEAIDEEYAVADNELSSLICRLYTLHRLFFTPFNPSADIKDDKFLRGLYEAPELLTLYLLNGFLATQRTGTQEEFYVNTKDFFNLQQLRYIVRTKNVLRRFGSQSHPSAFGLRRILEILNKALPPKTGHIVSATEQDQHIRYSTGRMPYALIDHALTYHIMSTILSVGPLSNALKLRIVPPNDDECQIASELLKQHLGEIQYLSSLPTGSKDTLAAILSDKCSTQELNSIKRSLSHCCFSSLDELNAKLRFNPSKEAFACLEEALAKCGLLFVPMNDALPATLRKEFKKRTLIDLPQDIKLDEDFIARLGAAQLALIICRHISQGGVATSVLANELANTQQELALAQEFLKTLDDECKTLAPLSDSFYISLYEQNRGKETYAIFAGFLKMLMKATLQNSFFMVYEQGRFEHVFSLLHLHITEKNTQRNGLGSSVFDNLNTSLISSRIRESQEVESVISRLREEENLSTSTKSALTGQNPIDRLLSSNNVDDQDQSTANSIDAICTVHQDTDEVVVLPNKKKTVTFDSKSNSLSMLVNAIKSQHTDVMDENEFQGLCLSLGFMSKDAAIEELNDRCFEEFNEPLLEASPEEGLIYITTDLLPKFIVSSSDL